MTFAARKIAAPPLNPESERFWKAAAEGQLLIGHCESCGKHHYYPRAICPHCTSDRVQWVAAAGTGTIYSFSPMRRAPEPYIIAYVTLAEGVTMMTNLIDCDPDRLQIGQAVKLVFQSAEGGQALPMFTPAQ